MKYNDFNENMTSPFNLSHGTFLHEYRSFISIFYVFLSSIAVELKYWFVAEKGDGGVYLIFYYAKACISLCAGIW